MKYQDQDSKIRDLLGECGLIYNENQEFYTPLALRKLDYVGSKLLRSTSLTLIDNEKWEKYTGLDN